MLSFSREIMSISAAVEAYQRQAEEQEEKPKKQDIQKRLTADTEQHKAEIMKYLSSRPSRRRWTTSSEVAAIIGVTTVRTSQILLRMKSMGIVDSRRKKYASSNVEWKMA